MNPGNIEKTNLRQKEFYNTKKKNIPTRIWSYFRNGILNKVRKNIGVEKQILELHVSWFGDLSKKKVLDLGCFEGNALSLYLAQNSKEYFAIDLSERGIEKLSIKLKNIESANARAIDFLSTDFTEKDFDLIYAYGVLHHFRDVSALIVKLNEKLSSKGQIVSYDPLKTSIPINILRTFYRPFQKDREWEWPFSKKVYYLFKNAFEIKERRAVLGKAKWFFVLSAMPFSRIKKEALLNKWHQDDWDKSKFSDANMFKCMHLTMLMQKKD